MFGKLRTLATIGLGLALLSGGSKVASAATITLTSGNTAIGTQDPSVKFLSAGTQNGDFASIGTAQFTAAANGTSSYVVTPNNGWIASLPGSSAKWISSDPNGGTNAGPTALFAVTFNVAAGFNTASLALTFATDNQLGQTNAGLYLNGTALPSSTGIGTYFQSSTYNADISSLLVVGQNTLYFDVVNLGGPTGLIFNAVITTAAVPEPASIVLGSTALVIGLGFRAARRRTRAIA